MTPALAGLYQRIILEHNARPRGFGPLAGSTHEAAVHNALCGDTVTLRLRLDEGRIAAAAFEGHGCALSRASASLLTLAVAGRTPDEAEALSAELHKLLARGPEHAEADAARLGDLTALQGVRDVPARLRCATLPWEALRAALAPGGPPAGILARVSKPNPPPRVCPCHSGRTYDACCAPYHRGAREAPDPTALMRSRYAAFALGEAEYLVRTLDAEHADRGLPRAELLGSLRGARDRLRYPSLAVLDSRQTADSGEVLFCAGLFERGKDQSFVELSDFAHDGTGWRYVSGILVPLAELGRPSEGLTIDAFLAIAGGY